MPRHIAFREASIPHICISHSKEESHRTVIECHRVGQLCVYKIESTLLTYALLYLVLIKRYGGSRLVLPLYSRFVVVKCSSILVSLLTAPGWGWMSGGSSFTPTHCAPLSPAAHKGGGRWRNDLFYGLDCTY